VTERSELSAQLRLAAPLAAQQIGFQMMGLVDAAMLGRLDDTALAAAGVGNTLLFGISSLGIGIVMGLDTVLPQALGAGRPDDARRSLGGGLRLAMLTGLACTLILLATPALLSVAGVPDDVASDARVYVDLRAIGVVPLLVSIALRSYLAAHNVTRPLIIATVAGNLANAALDLVLIYGLGPIPAMGVAGAAIATVGVQLALIAVYAAGIRRIDGHAPRPTSTRADLAEIVRYGLPISGQLFAEIGIFGVATILAAHLGKLPAAAHSIALNLASFTFSVAVGVGSATSVRVGHAIGAGDRGLARHRGMIGLGMGLAIMTVFAAIFVVLPGPLAALFTDQATVVAATIPLLQIAALFQLSDGAQAIAAGALRGIGDTRATFVGNVVGHYGVGLAISLALAFGAGMGAPGLWWGLSVGLTATATYLVLRFRTHTRIPGLPRATST
jgi:MATE family multidrug resistance protein